MLKYCSKIINTETVAINLVAFVVVSLFFCWPLRLQAKDFCGEEECYNCCGNNCEDIFLKEEDLGRKDIKKAIKSCNSGCSIILWQASSMSGRISKNAAKALNESCSRKDIAYPDYCKNAISLWGANCHTRKKIDKSKKSDKSKKPDKSEKADKSDKATIDEMYSQLERSTRENIAKRLLRKALPDLTDSAIETAMNQSAIMRGVNIGTITAPWRMAEELQQIINRVRRVEGIIPVRELSTLEGISSELEQEVRDSVSASKYTPPSDRASRQPSKSSIAKYKGMPPAKINSMLQQELDNLKTLSLKPGVSIATLAKALDRLLKVCEYLENQTSDPALRKQIALFKSELQTTFEGL